MLRPEIRYAQNGDVRIAYQVVGNGPLDLIIVPGLVSHLGLIWEDAEHAAFCMKLARLARLVLFDKRGTGLSDRNAGIPDLDERIEDLAAVMAAAGARRAAIFAFSEGGKMALRFAAAHPERVRALALYGAFARSPTRDWPPEQVDPRFALMERAWGQPMLPPTVAPSKVADLKFRRRWARFERESASPEVAGALFRMDHDVDVTDILAEVRVPTLVMHRAGDQRIGIEYGRYLAHHMPTARYVELPGVDHLPYIGDSAQIIALMGEFLTAARRADALAGGITGIKIAQPIERLDEAVAPAPQRRAVA